MFFFFFGINHAPKGRPNLERLEVRDALTSPKMPRGGFKKMT